MTKGSYLKQVIDETCNNVRNCKMTSMPPFKFEKIVNKERGGGGGSFYALNFFFCDQNEKSCKTIIRKGNVT
jgi:hypothetical protein